MLYLIRQPHNPTKFFSFRECLGDCHYGTIFGPKTAKRPNMVKCSYMKKIIIGLVILVVVLAGALVYFLTDKDTKEPIPENTMEQNEVPEVTNEEPEEEGPETNLGTSVEGRPIMAYNYGDGEERLVFVGGIHGGYSWNTVLVAYELMDHLEKNPEVIPDNVRVTVIPVMNPDALSVVVDSDGRFESGDVSVAKAKTIESRLNANDVDLNRNFDCDWQEEGTWQSRTVSGGDSVFSEPESQAFRNYVASSTPAGVVVWYSAAGGVFASSCHNSVSKETSDLTRIFAEASGYKAYEEFDFYEITGDMVNWLAKEKIPAISVLLSNHTEVEWDKNRKGIEALLNYYAKTE